MERAKIKPSVSSDGTVKSYLVSSDGTVVEYDSVEEFEQGFLVCSDGYFGFCKPNGEILLDLKYRKKIIPCGHALFIPSYTGHYNSLDLRINYITKDAFESVTEDAHYIYARNGSVVTRFLRANGAMVIDT